MEVILLKDVDKLGTEGAVVRVRPGYARNFLMPSGLAVPATPQQLKAAEEIKRQRQRKTQRAQAEAEAVKQKIEHHSLTLKLTVGEDDKPFGSVTTHDLVDALAKDGVPVEKHAIHLEEPIKTLGVYQVPVKLHAAVTATLNVWVVKA
ncbi:MAG: 50S ribosomal protein L9 [Candidatus Omnitrophica bacterium]|nr:50S ribosomal protein L9 [Candidatus Omnitrophota bacterium]